MTKDQIQRLMGELEEMPLEQRQELAKEMTLTGVAQSVRLAKLLISIKNDSEQEYRDWLEVAGMTELEATARFRVLDEYNRLWGLGYEGTALLERLRRSPAFERFEALHVTNFKHHLAEAFGVQT